MPKKWPWSKEDKTGDKVPLLETPKKDYGTTDKEPEEAGAVEAHAEESEAREAEPESRSFFKKQEVPQTNKEIEEIADILKKNTVAIIFDISILANVEKLKKVLSERKDIPLRRDNPKAEAATKGDEFLNKLKECFYNPKDVEDLITKLSDLTSVYLFCDDSKLNEKILDICRESCGYYFASKESVEYVSLRPRGQDYHHYHSMKNQIVFKNKDDAIKRIELEVEIAKKQPWNMQSQAFTMGFDLKECIRLKFEREDLGFNAEAILKALNPKEPGKEVKNATAVAPTIRGEKISTI